MTTSPGRLAYLAELSDAELSKLLAQNEREVDIAAQCNLKRVSKMLESDRAELIEEMKRRPDFGRPESRAASLTDAALAEAIDTAPSSAVGSPLHNALIAESNARAAKGSAPTHTPALIGTVRGSGRIEYFANAEIAAAWSDDALPCMVPIGADIISTHP